MCNIKRDIETKCGNRGKKEVEIIVFYQKQNVFYVRFMVTTKQKPIISTQERT